VSSLIYNSPKLSHTATGMVTKIVMYGGLALVAAGGYWWYTDPVGFSQFGPVQMLSGRGYGGRMMR